MIGVREFSEDLQYQIMEIVAHTNVYRVQIETHYKTVTYEKVKKILEILRGHVVAFEFGLESANDATLSIYNKDIDVGKLYQVVLSCNNLGIETSLNVMVGAPKCYGWCTTLDNKRASTRYT